MIDRYLDVRIRDATQAGCPIQKAVGRFLRFACDNFAMPTTQSSGPTRVDLEAAANAYVAQHPDRAAWLTLVLVHAWQEAIHADDDGEEDDDGEGWKDGRDVSLDPA